MPRHARDYTPYPIRNYENDPANRQKYIDIANDMYWLATGGDIQIRHMTDDHLVKALRHQRTNAVLKRALTIAAMKNGRYLFKGGKPTEKEIRDVEHKKWQDYVTDIFYGMKLIAEVRNLTWEDDNEIITLREVLEQGLTEVISSMPSTVGRAGRSIRI